MSEQQFLVSLFIGPVQSFIAAALRTRDLWLGSILLSEISKAAAKAMISPDVQLIFPAIDKKNDLNSNLEHNISNRILALVNGDRAKTEEVLKMAKQCALERMQGILNDTQKEALRFMALNKKIWDKQADPKDILELYSTLVPVHDNNLQSARSRLDHLTMARKNSRDFAPSILSAEEAMLFGLPKSSLDGCRETVLPSMIGTHGKLVRHKLRMGKNEQLDAVGLVKRLAWKNKADQFTPTTRIAIDSWLQRIKSASATDTLGKLASMLETLVHLESSLVTNVKGNKKIYADMPYDAGLLYPGPLGAALRDCENDAEKIILKKLKKNLLPEWEKHGKPCPYYALILADGDHMGDFLDKARDAHELRDISSCLSEFARLVPDIAREFQGHVIYAGGDDLLLMVPPEGALELADALRCIFSETMQDAVSHLHRKTVETPTLSVGMVLAHMQTPVGRVRRLVGEAEQLAKGTENELPRNALGIIVAPRSGAKLSIRIRWVGESFSRFRKIVDLYRKELLPTRFAFALRTLKHDLSSDQNVTELDNIKKMEFERILMRKQQGGGRNKLSPETIYSVLCHARDRGLSDIYPEHLTACWLAVHKGAE
jgi:CRISPR-associated protein Cmr2